MKDVEYWITVKKLKKKGMSIRKIAKELGISRNTVRKILREEHRKPYKARVYTTKIDEYKDKIKEWYLDPQYNFIGSRIYEELEKIGYQGSVGPIYRYLNQLKEEKQKISTKATTRVETEPGDQSQFDWSEYNIIINNKITKVYCFSLILSYSRYKAIAFSLSIDGQAIYEAIENLFNNLEGTTVELLIDNPKALVDKHEKEKEPQYNRNALLLAAHLGTELNACMPYRARTKGKVERPFNYIEEHFIKGNSFENMNHLNQSAKAFIDKWNNKIHTTTKRIPSQMYLEEKQSLLPLPKNLYSFKYNEPRKVSLDCLISVKGKKYSVPAKYADKNVKFRISYGYLLCVYYDGEIIATHDLTKSSCDINRIEEHYNSVSYNMNKSIPQVKRLMTSKFSNGKRYLDESAKVLQQPSYHARKILALTDLYSEDKIDKILSYCLDKNIYHIDDIKSTIKDKYFDIIFTDENIDIPKENLVRSLDYYEEGGLYEK